MRCNLSPTSLLLSCIIWTAGCRESPNASVKTPRAEETRSAVRLHAISESQDDVVPAGKFQTCTSGTVIELPTNAVKIRTKAFPDGTTMATSPNVDVWLDGEKVDLSTITIGDRVGSVQRAKGQSSGRVSNSCNTHQHLTLNCRRRRRREHEERLLNPTPGRRSGSQYECGYDTRCESSGRGTNHHACGSTCESDTQRRNWRNFVAPTRRYRDVAISISRQSARRLHRRRNRYYS